MFNDSPLLIICYMMVGGKHQLMQQSGFIRKCVFGCQLAKHFVFVHRHLPTLMLPTLIF